MYDVAIIGTGPAGLSAAITLKIRNKNLILFGEKDLSKKIRKAEKISNYPGFPEISGEELAERFSEHLNKMNIDINDSFITAIYAMGDYFSLTNRNNEMFEAKSVILATGVNFGKVLKGEEEFLGRGVSYCATCDAPLYRGKKVAVIGTGEEAEKEAEFLKEIAEDVIYIPMISGVEIEGDMKVKRIVVNGETREVDGVFLIRDSVSPQNLVPGLAVKERYIEVNKKMETNISGCFACGDVTGIPFQYIKAAGEGNIAALSAVEYLNKVSKNK